MRLCILMMALTSSHTLPAEKEGGRWRLGEFVDVFDADTRGGFNGADGSPAFYRIYVTDWPYSLERAKRWLLKPHYQDGDEDASLLVARRRRLIRASDLPGGVRTALNRDKYIEVTTANVKTYVRRRLDNLRGDDDVATDDEVFS